MCLCVCVCVRYIQQSDLQSRYEKRESEYFAAREELMVLKTTVQTQTAKIDALNESLAQTNAQV